HTTRSKVEPPRITANSRKPAHFLQILKPGHCFVKRPMLASIILTTGKRGGIERSHGSLQSTIFLLVATVSKLEKRLDGDLRAVREVFYFRIREMSGPAEIPHELDGLRDRVSGVFPAPPPNGVANFATSLLVKEMVILSH